MLKKENNINSICHPCVSENPAECKVLNTGLIRSGKTGEYESGRSMVEMLGVLAVMGVLSVGGVAMYTSAMNKHRANELLNEANKRAAIVAMQITSGRTIPSIAEFDNTTFSETVDYTPATKRFSFTLSGIDTAVCQQMKNMVGDKTQIRKINPGCTLITYNADLSTNDMIDVGECDNGNIYLSYAANPCAQNNANGNFECKKNSDCEVGEFCKIIAKTGNNSTPGSSTCEPIGTGTFLPTEDSMLAGKSIPKGTFLKAPWGLSWWSAKNWCQAQGRQLVESSDFNLQNGICSEENCLDLSGNPVNSDYWTNFAQQFGSRSMIWLNQGTNYMQFIYTEQYRVTYNTHHASYAVLCK